MRTTDSLGTRGGAAAMPDPKARRAGKAGRGGAEPLAAAAMIFFLLAAAFAAAPALNAGPSTIAGLLLLIGLAGVTLLGLFVLRGGIDPASEADLDAERLIDALSEPAAIAAPDGRLRATNAAWKTVM